MACEILEIAASVDGDDIVKMALVGDERWKEEAYIFVGKGLRKTEIEFFPPASLKQAEGWIRA